MEWKVEIRQFQGEKDDLEFVLNAIGYDLFSEGNKLFLSSITFNLYSKAYEVRERAEALSSGFNAIATHLNLLNLKFQLGSVFQQLEGGKYRQHAFSKAVHHAGFSASAKAGAIFSAVVLSAEEAAIKKRLKEKEERRETLDLGAKYISAMTQNSEIIRVLKLRKRTQNPDNLGRIYELVKMDLGYRIDKYVTKSQQNRFTQSINHNSVYGDDARHSVSKTQPPQKPMMLKEAYEFIDHLIEQWVLYYAKQAGYL